MTATLLNRVTPQKPLVSFAISIASFLDGKVSPDCIHNQITSSQQNIIAKRHDWRFNRMGRETYSAPAERHAVIIEFQDNQMMNFRIGRYCLAGLILAASIFALAGDVSAQCATCPTPTVAYQPVVAQPTVTYKPYTGWYPGKLLDQWRMRRAGIASAPAYTASYAPTYAASYAPAYTAAYAPSYNAAYAPAYTSAYRPYVSSYAPLTAPAAAPCNTCAQTSYYPVVQTVARPVLMRPVVAAPACDVCSYTPSCGCDACSSGVSQAAYNEPAYAQPGCSGCAGGGTVTNVLPPSSATGQNVGPQTPQPSLAPQPAPAQPAPLDSRYESNRPAQPEIGSGVDDVDPLDDIDPGPVKEEADSSTYYHNAPQLLDPRDRTASTSNSRRKPTVEVWNAVYRQTATNRQVSQSSSRRERSQAEIDAEGWNAVPRDR